MLSPTANQLVATRTDALNTLPACVRFDGQRNGYELAGETDVKTQAAFAAAIGEALTNAPCLLYIRNFGALRDVSTGQEPKGMSASARRGHTLTGWTSPLALCLSVPLPCVLCRLILCLSVPAALSARVAAR